MSTPPYPPEPGDPSQGAPAPQPPQFEKPSPQQPAHGEPAPQYEQPPAYQPPPGQEQPPYGQQPPAYEQPPQQWGQQPPQYAPPPAYGQQPQQWGQQPPPYYPPGPYAPTGPSLELSGWWARVGATIVDGFIALLIAVVLGTGIALLLGLDIGDFSTSGTPILEQIEAAEDAGEEWTPSFGEFTGDGWTFLIVLWVSMVLVSAVYGALFLSLWSGRTPGKKVAGIRVVDEHGQVPTNGTAWKRELLVKRILIDAIGGAILFGLPALLNYLWPLWDSQCRAGHDHICKTRVIKDRGPLPPAA